MGWKRPVSGILLGYPLTWASFGTIGVSSVLGLLVNLSTFLVGRRFKCLRAAPAAAA
jgi:hypothetical protein